MKRDADENACLRTMSATRYLKNKDAVDLPRGLGGGSAVAIVAKGGSDRDCLRRIHNGGTSEGKAGQGLIDRKRVRGRLMICPRLWVKENQRHVKYLN